MQIHIKKNQALPFLIHHNADMVIPMIIITLPNTVAVYTIVIIDVWLVIFSSPINNVIMNIVFIS